MISEMHLIGYRVRILENRIFYWMKRCGAVRRRTFRYAGKGLPSAFQSSQHKKEWSVRLYIQCRNLHLLGHPSGPVRPAKLVDQTKDVWMVTARRIRSDKDIAADC